MKHMNYLEAEPVEMTEAGAHKVRIRTVIGEADGAPNFFMRIVTFEANGASPNHSHPWEHENYILSGRGILEVDGRKVELKPGDVIYIPPNAHHCFRATEPMEMI
ncbi:MAG: cupin domain-containing protein [Deltaproteobacteria bacterium]|nr:cupin domain-containing protein [Deltaproteobacteria bacterium]MBW1931120.1 cupin domain-containing protein [Deltaproteobacteria bacterium]MBW2025507.1 cupin domain-containing protein [Deltaproteobacteria bacterium]MBW2125305.1 cupin domain-containing protein [Deltaproteobacteria bacterium]